MWNLLHGFKQQHRFMKNLNIHQMSIHPVNNNSHAVASSVSCVCWQGVKGVRGDSGPEGERGVRGDPVSGSAMFKMIQFYKYKLNS